MSNKRAVTTDALETMGTILTGTGYGRDAIHLAVEPAVAGEDLQEGERVGRFGNGTYGRTHSDLFLGIVDPFLPGGVKKGQRFWLVVYPRTITSLRHVWEHPAFPSEKNTPAAVASRAEKSATGDAEHIRELDAIRAEARAWLIAFAHRNGLAYEELADMLEGATRGSTRESLRLIDLNLDSPELRSHWAVAAGT